MHLDNIYVYACIWKKRDTIKKIKNGHGWVQLGWTVYNWGRVDLRAPKRC